MSARRVAPRAAADSADPRAARRSSRRRSFLLLAIPLLVAAAAEVGLRRLLGPGLATYRRLFGVGLPTQLAIFRSPDAMLGIPPRPHEASRRLCWRNKPNYVREPYRTNSHRILSPREIPYARADERYRLLVLGDSSTAGLGLASHADAWPQVLQAMFPDTVEVVNAATIGYSTEQARRYLRVEGRKYRPDGLAIYLGNNDSFASAIPDRALLDALRAPPGALAVLDRWLVDHSATYLLLHVGAGLLGGTRPGATAPASGRRVPLDDFAANVRALVAWAESHAVDVYLITPPTPLEYPPRIAEFNIRTTYDPRWAARDACLDDGESPDAIQPALLGTADTAGRYPQYGFPIRTYAARTLGCFRGRLAEQRGRLSAGRAGAVGENNLGWVEAESGDLEQALAHVRRAIAMQPDVPEFHYNAGLLLRRRGDEAAAVRELQQAVDLDLAGTRIHSAWLERLRAIARDDPAVVLVDASRAFRAGPNEELFSDHVHPNQRGQALVAQLVARAVEPPTRAARHARRSGP